MSCNCRQHLEQITQVGEKTAGGEPNQVGWLVRAFHRDQVDLAERALQAGCRYAELRRRLVAEGICPECLSLQVLQAQSFYHCPRCGRAFDRDGVEQ